MYGGILSLNEQDTSDILKVLVAADELRLEEIVDYLQEYLIESESEWMEQHFECTQRISFQCNNLLKIQQFCTDFMTKSPEKVFQSLYFTSLPEKIVISLIKRDDLRMKEIEVWEQVLKWGLAQNHTLLPDPSTWSDDDFKTIENTLQHCLPLIRFFSLSSKEFLEKVRPFKKLLNHKLYDDLVNSYMDPDSEPNDNISLPRIIKTDEIIGSKIINLNIISIISRWIDKVEINNKFAYLRELYLLYKFELLLRGSVYGFIPKTFHTLCDNKTNTVTFIKIKGTEEILGGYNPSIWKNPSNGELGQTKYSFIFSFKNKNNSFKDAIISNIENIDCAINCHSRCGPYFGHDIIIHAPNETTNYDTILCKKRYYEEKIRDTEKQFSMEDYEVFQIVKK